MESNAGHGSTVLNKILIPVITTVLGATAIYFLGFNKKSSSGRTDMEQMLLSKEATVKAWKSFVTAQNIEYKNEKSLMDEFTQKMTDVKKTARGYEDFVPVLRDFEKDLTRERKKTTQDVENIVKDPDIDRDFLSMLNRVLDNSKDYDNKLDEFFDNFVSIAKSDQDETEKGKRIGAEGQKFEDLEKKMNDRVTNEAESIAKVLADKYNQAFNLNELDVYVDIKKEKDKKPDEPAVKNNPNGPAPVDPTGSEVKQNNPPAENGGNASSSYNTDQNYNNNNTIEPTASLLTGQWQSSGSILELSANGELYWPFDGNSYLTGDWKLTDGKLRMNATNPNTNKTTVLLGFLSNVSRNSFTMTFMTTPKEVYNFTRKK